MLTKHSFKNEPVLRINAKAIQKAQIDRAKTKIIGDYSFCAINTIGCGLTSRVYKGQNHQTNQNVAIKDINLSAIKDKQSKECLNEEIRLLKEIKKNTHENLLTLENVIERDNHLYIVTQFCEGRDIGKLLKNKQRIFQFEAQSIMKQLINGYRQLHQLGYLHRDLKLANLLVRRGKLKIGDFGFAIPQKKAYFNFQLNVGSPYYMAPQTLKYNHYTVKSDIWAIGIIAFELIYGQAPWKDKVDSKLFDKIKDNSVEKLFNQSIKVSEEYKQFIKKCLNPDFKSRANPDYIFNYDWPLALCEIEGSTDISESFPLNLKNKVQKKWDRQEEQKLQKKVIGELNYCELLASIYIEFSKSDDIEDKILRNDITYFVQEKTRKQTQLLESEGEASAIMKLRSMVWKKGVEYGKILQVVPIMKKNYSLPSILLNNFDFRRKLLEALKKNLIEHWKKIKILFLFFQLEELPTRNLQFLSEYEKIFNSIRYLCNGNEPPNTNQLKEVQTKLKIYGL